MGSFGGRGGSVGKLYDAITSELAEWLGRQRVFFVATDPLAADGLLNCSLKGMDTFRILGPREVAYLDLCGRRRCAIRDREAAGEERSRGPGTGVF
jgi:hypothetical protein